MSDFVLLILISFIAYGVGDFIARSMKIRSSRLENFVFSTGLGLGIIAYIVFILGQAGLVYFKILIITLCVLFALFFKNILLLIKDLYSYVKNIKIGDWSLFDKILLAVLTLAFVFSLAGALAPPIGNDALAYHLIHPKIFIKTHSVSFIPYTRESLWPYLTEMLFTLGMLLENSILAKLFHYLFGVLAAIAVYCFARRFVNRKAGLLSAALFYLSPGIFMQASYAYVDLSLCFYVFCAFYLFLSWITDREIQYLVFSGILFGLALSVKILAAIGLIPVLVLLLYVLVKEKNLIKTYISHLSAFLIPLFLFSFIWYLRSYLITGNPVYPFMHEVFGSGWSAAHIAESYGYMKGPIGLLRLPWDLVMHMESFGGEQIGFLFLALLPALIFTRWGNRSRRFMAFFMIIYMALWFKIDQNIRFLFPVFPVAFVLISDGLDQIFIKRNFKLLKTFISIGLVFNLSLAFYYNVGPIKILTGRISEDEYLLKKERTYAVSKWVNSNVSKDSLLILAGETREYYFDPHVIKYKRMTNTKKTFQEITAPYKSVYILCKDDTMDESVKKLIYAKKPLFTSSFTEDGIKSTYSIYKLR